MADRRPDGGIGLRCEGVVHLYPTVEGHDVVALRGVELTVEPGERLAFLGPSGSGKSTLLSLLGGITRPSAGRIFLGEHEISRLSERQLAPLRASVVSTMLQGAGRNLLPYATARQNLAFARLGLSASAQREAVPDDHLLELVRLEEQGDQVAATMSGGQRQRLALACAVATRPRLLLADEPTSQLGHADRDDVVRLIATLGDELGTTIIVVTHEPEVARSFPRTLTMRNGRVGAEGRSGVEYVVVGADGLVHLPERFDVDWPEGTMARVQSDGNGTLVLSKLDSAGAEDGR